MSGDWRDLKACIEKMNKSQDAYMKRRKELGLKPGDSYLEALGFDRSKIFRDEYLGTPTSEADDG